MSRPIHFAVGFSGQTLCGKDVLRVRYTRQDVHWENTSLADGKRCKECRKAKEANGE